MAKQKLETIKNWFKTSLKPTQQHFWDTWDSFWHKDDKIPTSSIENLDIRFDEKADAELVSAHLRDTTAHGLNNKVDKEAGKGLSSNDYTTAEKEKLSGIQEAATANEEDDYLLDRTNHTGVQEISTVNGLQGTLDAKADLVEGKVPTNQLPAYVDDVLEHTSVANFPETGENGKIYIAQDTNTTYRWGGTAYVAIGSDLALGETSSTAYRGDNGKTAYDHSLLTAGNPHQVSKADVGLGNVDNTSDSGKPVSTATQTALNDKADLIGGKVPASQLPEENGSGVSLGETSSTAYRGDYGKTAYDHSQLTSGNPHQVSKTDVGLSNVDNTSDINKPVSAAQSAALTTKLTAALASDAEAQITATVAEDARVVSRLKLFNWWVWVKEQALKLGNTLTLMAGTTTSPPLIIPNGVLTTTPQNGAIERDVDGNIWETHTRVRSRFITSADGLILVAFKSRNLIQLNISGSISATITKTSNSILIGSIANISVLRLNAINEVYNPSHNSGTIAPTIAKTEVFLKINNGLFSTHFSGFSPVSQVKIMEFSGLNNNGFKNYQSPILTQIQSSDPLAAQWSSITFVAQSINNGTNSSQDVTYYLRNADNTRAFGASEASFCFVFLTTVTYDDSTNANAQNTDRIIRLNNHAIYLETIK